MSVVFFSLVPCPTTESNLCWEKTKVETPFALTKTGIQYQYTHTRSMILSLCQILVLVTQCSNSGQKS